MPQSFSAVFIHLVFSTKNRVPYLRDKSLCEEMHAYLGGVSKTLDAQPLIVGGTEDHIHTLCRLGREVSIAGWVKELKRVSSLWIKDREPALRDFSWQAGYGAFSVSASNMDAVRAYIAGQAEHHQKQSFQDEYRLLLRKHGIERDEHYVWE
ncbi:MAG: Transposase IS200 like protein [Candidatus Hydrogenedentes bacterium ADurb.Bin179]|nr:MAG: Transposase IS200 like protein [Candidatus Hydrogenedentes bacterium ADurb.Bin179]